jgi:hypothetical protein
MQQLTPANGMSVSRFDLSNRNPDEGLPAAGLVDMASALIDPTPGADESYEYNMTEAYVPPAPRMM